MSGGHAGWLVEPRVCPAGVYLPVMSDDPSNRGPADRSRINVHEAHEVSYWTKALGVSREQLEQAVKAVGVSAAAVRKHLGQ